MTHQDPYTGSGTTDADASTRVLPTQSSQSQGSSWSGTSGSDDLGQKASDAAQDVKGKVEDAAGKVRDQASSQLNSQKEKATGTLDTVAQAMRKTGNQLRDDNQDAIAQYADRAADEVQKLSGYLQNRDIGQLVTEVERFARRQPGIFLGGAFLLGAIGARFLKSSSEQAQYGSRYQSGNYGAYSTGYSRQYGGDYGYSRSYRDRYDTGYSGSQSGGGGYSMTGGTQAGYTGGGYGTGGSSSSSSTGSAGTSNTDVEAS